MEIVLPMRCFECLLSHNAFVSDAETKLAECCLLAGLILSSRPVFAGRLLNKEIPEQVRS
jgi:hypothetical protein